MIVVRATHEINSVLICGEILPEGNAVLRMKHHTCAVKVSFRTCSLFWLSVFCRDERLSHIPAATATPQMAAIIQIFNLMTSPYHTGFPNASDSMLCAGSIAYSLRGCPLSVQCLLPLGRGKKKEVVRNAQIQRSDWHDGRCAPASG
jgi:hypothetical protein